MPLQVRACTQADIPDFVMVERAAFADNLFTPILFPGPFPEDALEFRTQEFAKQLAEDSSSRCLKVVDMDGPNPNKGIAFAKWNVYKDQFPGTPQTRIFGQGCNTEACELVFGGLWKQRERLLGDKHCVYLHILVTDPAHARRGAAGMLIEWGVAQGKENRLPIYLDSSPAGHELYQKHGFKDIGEHSVDLSKFGAKEFHRTWTMMRDVES